jgi:glycosyltransferase involved in cell wall biosynthesis
VIPGCLAQFTDSLSFGDALFPLLTAERLGHLYELRTITAREGLPQWCDAGVPNSIHAEVSNVGDVAGVLLGGGDVIRGPESRGDENQASGALERLACPLLWIGAGVRAARAGVPLCWLAPGVRGPFDPGLAGPLRWLADVSELIAVRDEASRQQLSEAGVRGEILVVPDPGWGIGRIWDSGLLRAVASEHLRSHGLELESGYVAVELPPQRHAGCSASVIAAAVSAIANAAGCRPLLIQVRAGALERSFAEAVAGSLTEAAPIFRPHRVLDVAAVVSGSVLFAAASLHGLITALALGVPGIGVAPDGLGNESAFVGQLEQATAERLLVTTWRSAEAAAEVALAMGEEQRLRIASCCAEPLEQLWARVETTLSAPVDVERKRAQLRGLIHSGAVADDPRPGFDAVIATWMGHDQPVRRGERVASIVGARAAQRRLEQRLEVANRELLEAHAERQQIAAIAEQLRQSTIDYQRDLNLTATQRRALSAALDRMSASWQGALGANQRLRAERDELKWRRSDLDLALNEARALFRAERALVDELTEEVRLALSDLRHAEASLGSRLGHAIANAASLLNGRAAGDALYLGLARLDELDGRLAKRPRPVLRDRPSRVGTARRRVTVISWDMGHNPAGRAHILAQMLGRSHDVELIGPLFSRYGEQVWAPIRGADVPVRTFPGSELPEFVNAAERFVSGLRTDLVVASKPRFPSLLLAMLIKHSQGVPVVLDVDDRELSFFGATAGISFAELEGIRDADVRLPFGRSWTLACDQLVAGADAVTVSSEALQQVYGGAIVPHARDERLLNPARYDRDEIRAELGYSREDRVVLFSGTPRVHKGLGELAEALEQIGDPRFKLCVVGTIQDRGLRDELSRFGPHRVQLLDDRPWSELPRTTLIGDLVCLLQRPDNEISRYQTPAKLTDALAMGVPVLARDTPTLDPFARAGAIALVGDAPLAERLAALLEDAGESRRLAQVGREYFLKNLSYAAVTETLDLLVAELGGTAAEPAASWHRALTVARDVEARPGAARTPARIAPRLFPARRRTWDVVFFWKQNDSWIYGRRSDMLMKYLARSDRTHRLVHFDAPTNWEAVQHYRRRARGAPADQAAELYRRLRRRALFADRHGKLRSYTFLARSKHEPGALERAFLPTDDEYLGFIEYVLKRRGIGKRRPVLFWVWPVNFQFPEVYSAFAPDMTVADVVDDHRAWVQPGTSYYERLTNNYAAVLGVSDVVLANCEPVRERMSWFGVDPLVVPNAMEIVSGGHRPSRRPRELRKLHGPVIGYVGNLGSRIDIPLIDRLASERTDCQIVIVGSAHLSNDILALDRYTNVHFLGVRPYPEVLRYIRCFDVAVIPHYDDQLTRAMNPLKAYVYAGCGVPVVTTEIANLPDLGAGIRVARSHDDFLLAVAELLEKSRAGEFLHAPRELLDGETWERRVEQIERLLDAAGEMRSARATGTLIPA